MKGAKRRICFLLASHSGITAGSPALSADASVSMNVPTPTYNKMYDALKFVTYCNVVEKIPLAPSPFW
jgi:hypothetical protein